MDRAATSGLPAERKAVTRDQVLLISARTFAAHGYQGTNLKLVAERLGVTRQALYYHFASKDEILAALFESLMTRLEVRALMVRDDAGRSGGLFRALLLGNAEVMLSQRTLASVLTHERPALAGIEWLEVGQRRRDYGEMFSAAYREGEASGELRPAPFPGYEAAILSAVNLMCICQDQDGPQPRRLTATAIVDSVAVGTVAPAVLATR